MNLAIGEQLLQVQQAFAKGKAFDLIILVAVWLLALYFMRFRKREIWIRRLPALDFIEECAGRAAEMARPLMYNIGGGGPEDVNAPATVASLSVLGYVARLTARHGVELIAPMRVQASIPMAQEVIRTAYAMEGKSDVYETKMEEMLIWAPQQSNQVALIQRTKPAVSIMIGPFWHESVQLAEISQRLGAVQIGGTNRLVQIPFFAAVCDMCLIGEEVFVVGAYLSRSTPMLGSLAAEDWFKVMAMFFGILGTALATMGPVFVKPLMDLFVW